jgi:hypothetical protein
MSQRRINLGHRKNADDAINLSFGNGSEVIGHYHGIGQQAGLLAFWRRKEHGHTAQVIGPKQSTGDHGHDDLV